MVKQNTHPEDIKAAVRKRYGSVEAAARAHGITGALMRKAIYFPRPGGNTAIAKALGRSLHDLWPEWFDARGRRLYLRHPKDSRRASANHRQKSRAA